MRLTPSDARLAYVRDGLLTLFILFTTRVANQISPEAGAAHQAIRSVWMFFALLGGLRLHDLGLEVGLDPLRDPVQRGAQSRSWMRATERPPTNSTIVSPLLSTT